MSAELVIRAVGTPTPVGSFFAKVIGRFLKPNLVMNPRAILVPDNSKSAPWRAAVVAATENAIRARPLGWVPLSSAVEVQVVFWLAKPKTVRRLLPFVKPDVDKLARNSLDGLTEAKVFVDDALVTDLIARKRYARPGQEPGAKIIVRALSEQGALL